MANTRKPASRRSATIKDLSPRTAADRVKGGLEPMGQLDQIRLQTMMQDRSAGEQVLSNIVKSQDPTAIINNIK